jgi:hypothetical protein
MMASEFTAEAIAKRRRFDDGIAEVSVRLKLDLH